LIQSYEEFTKYVPLIEYADIATYIDQIKQKTSNVLWPGITDKFAVSSGTTGQGKHLPITRDRVKADLRFMRSVVWDLLRKSDFRIFGGTHLSIVGSLEKTNQYEIGEISAILASSSPKWIRFMQYPDPYTSIYEPWGDRFETILQTALERDIRVISGVPSWIFVLFKEVVKRSGKSIEQLWPNLHLIITGGVALSAYIEILTSYLGSLQPAFYENYGASEGYYAHGWFDQGWMGLKYDHGIFYEFIPKEEAGRTSSSPLVLPLWEVEPKVTYQLVVSHFGLWRYKTNDLIEFKAPTISSSIHPSIPSPTPTLRIIGRANEMTDDYGEALSADEARKALQSITALPTPRHLHVKSTWHLTDDLPYHEWIMVYDDSSLLFSGEEPYLQAVATKIDEWICDHNRHYAMRRQAGVLGAPKLTVYDMEAYTRLLASLPKAQSKLPFFIKMPQA
jgi:hypothetical protein